jgi:hypothetical protein
MWPYTSTSAIPGKDVRGRRGLMAAARGWGKSTLQKEMLLRGREQALFDAAVRREAPFAGLYALANQARARWALEHLIERLHRGEPLSTRLDFVEAAP